MDPIPFFPDSRFPALLSDCWIVAVGDGIGGYGSGSVRIGVGIGVGVGNGRILELLFEFLDALSQSLNLSI